MRIEQKINTVIYADEGKVLKRKSDGLVVGDSVYLGYNYYEAGILLNEPKESTEGDFVEVDKSIYERLDTPENYSEVERTEPVVEYVYTVDLPMRLKRMLEIVLETKGEINTYNLTDEEALLVKELFPTYEDIVNQQVTQGFRFTYKDKLYKVLLDTLILVHYEPSELTKELYTEVIPG